MKNKKGLSTKLAVILLIISILLLGAIMLAIILGVFDEPHFAIYTEECRNETNDYSELSGIGCNIGCLYYRKTINGSWNDSGECEKFCKEYVFSKEICEQVEVDEIDTLRVVEILIPKEEIYGIRVGYNYTIETYEGEKYFRCNLKNDDYYCETLDGYEISKQDLTIEWLDKNAVCHKCLIEETKDGRKNVIIDGWEKCEIELAGFRPCLEYKYKDYTIETWEQIK